MFRFTYQELKKQLGMLVYDNQNTFTNSVTVYRNGMTEREDREREKQNKTNHIHTQNNHRKNCLKSEGTREATTNHTHIQKRETDEGGRKNWYCHTFTEFVNGSVSNLGILYILRGLQ